MRKCCHWIIKIKEALFFKNSNVVLRDGSINGKRGLASKMATTLKVKTLGNKYTVLFFKEKTASLF